MTPETHRWTQTDFFICASDRRRPGGPARRFIFFPEPRLWILRFYSERHLTSDPTLALTISTWDDSGPYREMDTIEISRWGEPGGKNARNLSFNRTSFQLT